MKNIIRMILGIGEKPKEVKFKIKPVMITPDVCRIDMKSLRDYLKTDEGRRKNGLDK